MKSIVYELVDPLSGNEEYTSGTRSMNDTALDFGSAVCNFVVLVDSDQNGTLEVETSTDQIVWDEAEDPTDYVGGTGILQLSVLPPQMFVRAKFTNGPVAQTYFSMVTGVDYP